MNKGIYFLIIISLLLGAIYFVLNQSKESDGINIVQNSSVDSSNTTVINNPEKKEYEAYIDLGEKALDKTGEFIDKTQENKRQRDSIRLANRSTFWAYKIGGAKSDPEDFKELYESLNEISNIYIFKVSRSEFFLIKYDGSSNEEQLANMLSEVKSKLEQAGVDEELEIKNLTKNCEFKEDVALVGKEKVARKMKVDCYSCQ